MQPSPPNSSENGTTANSGAGLRRDDSNEFHRWPAEQLQKLRLGLPEEESLEQGPLLGRGGFGKVYKGEDALPHCLCGEPVQQLRGPATF
jgi:hypothetical protein